MIPSVALTFLTLALGNAIPARDSLLSHRLTQAALDQEALLHLDSALTLLSAARHADSTDVVAEYQYVELRRRRYELGALRDEYAASAAHWRSRSSFCWTPWILAYNETRSTISDVVSAESAEGPTPCTTAQMSLGQPQSTGSQLEYATRAVAAFPGVPILWIYYASVLERSGLTSRAGGALRDGANAMGHPLLRVQLAMAEVGNRLQLGDSAGARARLRVVRSAVLRDGRSGLLYAYLESVRSFLTLSIDEGDESRVIARLVRVCESSGDFFDAARTLGSWGHLLTDRGEPLKAIPILSLAVAMADRTGVSDLQLEMRTLRGRAYLKAGRLSEAKHDLLAAVAVGERAGRVYFRAEAYHNLAHTYESEGEWPEAARAVDRFVALARPMAPHGLGLTSLLDAGEIRWKAGWHASAVVAFDEMVRRIEREQDNFYYAGEFFERAGDLDRAKMYYERGVTANASDPASLAGMSRVHAALGHADSAEAWARAHDAKIVGWPPLEVPLLPVLLAKRGRFTEATRIARSWADRQIRAGNVEGAAIATLQLAQLLLDARHADSALAEAERTDSIASRFNLTRQMIRARTLRGTAVLRLGRQEAGVRILESALALALRDHSADILFETRVALGEALAATARTAAALHEYDLAALTVEHATLSISEDVDRAGYRERNLLPFDGAVRLLLASHGRLRRADELVRWMSRRNGAALAVAVSGGAGARSNEPHAPGLAELQSRLDASELLLSYTVLDSAVWAIAIAKAETKLVQLPIGAAALSARVDAIRRPLVSAFSGRLDLARSRYDVKAAAELYAALINPFARELAGKTRLLIAPGGPLNALAFDALVASPTTYLIDSFEIEYVPSPAFLRPRGERSREQRLDAARLLAVGYEAPGNAAEIQALRDVWPRERLTTIESLAATESSVKRRMRSFGVVHFAVHATADTRDPLASHLQLVGDSIDDGFLHVNEIAVTRTEAKLVVLSACETNAGPIYSGEGVMGIARAFLAGGARGVVGTQWPIGAESAVLMREFYTRLAHGDAPAAALRAAKLLMRRSPDTAHPFHWAGYVLIR